MITVGDAVKGSGGSWSNHPLPKSQIPESLAMVVSLTGDR